MASKAKSVWAIDVGNCSLKALNLSLSNNGVEVLDFEVIEHSKILSAPDVSEQQREEELASSLAKFSEKHDLKGQYVAISVAGQTSFARFIKLPPVEPKKIPQIIQFEAAQQIPFDINEVEWDYQIMDEPDSPEVSVGIFAIKNEIISDILDSYSSQNIRVSSVQMAPIALYNYAYYDNEAFSKQPNKATVIVDMGTDNTNIVICSENSVWQRSIPIGGNEFTESIADAFKLDFAKAEKLKRTAPVSKYSKQIFQAMKPVYTNFAEEIQRSIGYFGSTNDIELSNVVALGGGMKLQGLTKYLQQSLGVPVARPDSYKRLSVGQGTSSAKFHENLAEYAVAYGVGVQALGEAKIKSDLLPKKIARAMAWQQKSSILMIAAAVLLVAGILCLMRAFIDKGAYASNKSTRASINSALSRAKAASSALAEQENRDKPLNDAINKQFSLFNYRNVIPNFIDGLISCLPNAENTPDQAKLFEAFKSGDVDTVKSIPRGERKMLFITSCKINYTDSVASATFGLTQRSSGHRRKSKHNVVDPGMPGMYPEMQVDGYQEDKPKKEDGAGFLVVIEGYSPYAKMGELLDPAGVGNDKSKWGFITRLIHFNKLFKKGRFKLFDKDSVSSFVFEQGEVDLNSADMPDGIGEKVRVVRVHSKGPSPNTRSRSRNGSSDRILEEDVLIDPMTGEEISKVAVIDETGLKQFDKSGEEKYIVRDHWFRIKAKFTWKDAPEEKKGGEY